MTRDERRLLRHLVIAVLVKLAVLVVLWALFVRGAAVHAGSDRTAAHLAAPAAPVPSREGAHP